MVTAVNSILGQYNFAIDTGAQGTYNVGIKIPIKTYMTGIHIGIITSFTSGGAATIDFGYSPIGSVVAANANAFTSGGAIAIASLVSTGQAGYSIATTMFAGSFAYNLTMRINAADLTAGRAIITPIFTYMQY